MACGSTAYNPNLPPAGDAGGSSSGVSGGSSGVGSSSSGGSSSGSSSGGGSSSGTGSSSGSGGGSSSGSSSGSAGPVITTVVGAVADPSATSQALKLEGIAVDTSGVYLVGQSRNASAGYPSYLLSVPLSGGNATVLTGCTISGQPCAQNQVFDGLTIDSQYVYGAVLNAATYRIPKGGGTLAPFVSNSADCQGPTCPMSANGTQVCWNFSGNTVMCEPAADTGPPAATVTASGMSSFDGLAIDSSSAYMGDFDGTGGAPTIIGASMTSSSTWMIAIATQIPQHVAVDATDVYWVTPTFPPTTFYRAPKAGGGTTVTLATASSSDYVSGISVDATSVWFVTEGGGIKRFPK